MSDRLTIRINQSLNNVNLKTSRNLESKVCYSSIAPPILPDCFSIYMSLSLPLSLYIYLIAGKNRHSQLWYVKGRITTQNCKKNIYNCKNQLKIKEKIRQNRKFNCLVAVVMGFFYGMMRVWLSVWVNDCLYITLHSSYIYFGKDILLVLGWQIPLD